MKIISFGHIPSWAGGRQESGLANVIYQLAKHMSDCDNVEMSIAATDIFVPQKRDEKLTLYGWSKKMLINYAIFHPLFSLNWLLRLIKAKFLYGPVISIPGFFFKGLHLAKTISIVKPDVVHLHGMNACVYEHVVQKDVKIIVTMHGIIGTNKTIPFQRYLYLMERDTCHSNRYDMVGFIAEKLIDDFSKLYGGISSPFKAIRNAYDSKSFYYIEPAPHKKLTLATIASLSENKGQKRVIKAIAESGVSAKYICIGNSSETQKAEYADFAKNHNVEYDYRGKRSPKEIREILSEVDYMILPSSTEGFGLVYLEAIACGVPVILPGHLPIVQEKGIIQPGINALLLEDSSVKAIASLLPSLSNYHFNHKKVTGSIIGYSWEDIAKEYVQILNEIISNKYESTDQK